MVFYNHFLLNWPHNRNDVYQINEKARTLMKSFLKDKMNFSILSGSALVVVVVVVVAAAVVVVVVVVAAAYSAAAIVVPFSYKCKKCKPGNN
jgi:hypothetical protein